MATVVSSYSNAGYIKSVKSKNSGYAIDPWLSWRENDITNNKNRERAMTSKLEVEEYLYRRAIDIIESPDTDEVKETLLFQEVWMPLADLYKDKIIPAGKDPKE